jgi:hypothetical protein
MTARAWIAITLGAASLLTAGDAAREFVEVTHTERVDFPSGGTLRLPNSSGLLTIEAWDQADIEVTTVRTIHNDAAEREKATHELDAHHLAAKRDGNDVVVTANAPWFSDLEYRIKAPASARLMVHHRSGNVNVDGLASDIDISLSDGQILLHVPEYGHYDINARTGIGHVDSDFQGDEKRANWLFGHRIDNGNAPGAQHKLNLRVKAGDILILKTRVPATAAGATNP